MQSMLQGRVFSIAVLSLIGLAGLTISSSQVAAQPIVVSVPEGAAVIRKGIAYAETADGVARELDLYLPSASRDEPLPVVVFVNRGYPDLRNWEWYQSWAALVASAGMAAVVYDADEGDGDRQLRQLLDTLRERSADLQLDPSRIALWASSGHVPIAWPYAMSGEGRELRALVIYYGRPMSTAAPREDLPLFVVRTGIDSPQLNADLDGALASAIEKNVDLHLVTYPSGRHGFDGFDDTERSRRIIEETVEFLKRHLEAQ